MSRLMTTSPNACLTSVWLEWTIARKHGITLKQVREAIIQLSPTIDHETRRRELLVDLARIDRLTTRFYVQALQGDVASAAITIKLSERRALLWGWDSAPNRQVPTIVIEQPESRPTSTERIRAAIEFVVSQRSVPPAANGGSKAAEAPQDSEKLRHIEVPTSRG
jgi:hypothetical protein